MAKVKRNTKKLYGVNTLHKSAIQQHFKYDINYLSKIRSVRTEFVNTTTGGLGQVIFARGIGKMPYAIISIDGIEGTDPVNFAKVSYVVQNDQANNRMQVYFSKEGYTLANTKIAFRALIFEADVD